MPDFIPLTILYSFLLCAILWGFSVEWHFCSDSFPSCGSTMLFRRGKKK